jgi:hypothetical protein
MMEHFLQDLVASSSPQSPQSSTHSSSNDALADGEEPTKIDTSEMTRERPHKRAKTEWYQIEDG